MSWIISSLQDQCGHKNICADGTGVPEVRERLLDSGAEAKFATHEYASKIKAISVVHTIVCHSHDYATCHEKFLFIRKNLYTKLTSGQVS